MNNRLRYTTLTVVLWALWATSAQAQCPPHCVPFNTPVQIFYTYDLQITSIPDPPYIENQPMNVGYKLVVGKAGIIGELPAPRTGSICGAHLGSSCVSLGTLSAGRTFTGTVTTTAAAGAHSQILIRLMSPVACPPGVECFNSDELTEGSLNRPVAARYTVSIDGYTILRTRAVHEDTVKINLMGAVDGQRSAQADACNVIGPPIYCITNASQGDHNDGSYLVTGVSVGPYDLIPDTDPDLKFGYSVLNMGTSYNQRVAQKIFDGISDVTAGALNAYSSSSGGNGSGWSGLNDFTHKINSMEFGGCDGPVAVDAKSILNQIVAGSTDSTLNALTRDTGRFSRTEGPYEIDSQDGCGKSGQYLVTWTVNRVSWLPRQ